MVLFLLLFSCCWSSSGRFGVTPKGDYFFRFAPCTRGVHGFRSGHRSSLSHVSSHTTRARFQREFSPLFHGGTRWGLCLYFLAAPPDFPDKIEKRPNQRARKRITALLMVLFHAHTTRWATDDGNHIIAFAKFSFPFVTHKTTAASEIQSPRTRKSDRSMSTLLVPGPEHDFAAKWNAYRVESKPEN